MKTVYEIFPDNQYVKEASRKELIVLHHTVSSSVQSAVEWWKISKERVATAFIIAKDGTIHQVFDPEYWAYHIGKGSTEEHNKRSIGIEIVNEGLLTQSAEGDRSHGEGTRYLWLDGKAKFNGMVYRHSSMWRGSFFFAAYTEEQYEALAYLLNKITKDFNIEKRFLLGFSYSASNLNYKGICAHHNLRADKSDVSVAFDYNKLIQLMNPSHVINAEAKGLEEQPFDKLGIRNSARGGHSRN